MAVACSGGCDCSHFFDLQTFQFPLQYHHQIESLRGRVCQCAFVGESMCVHVWQDDLIHQGLPLPSFWGTKLILQRGTFTFTWIQANNPTLTPRPGDWLGAAEPCYSTDTQKQTITHTEAQTPISLNLGTCLCIRTRSVSPPLGFGMHSEAVCLILCASSLSLSVHLPVFIFFHLRANATSTPGQETAKRDLLKTGPIDRLEWQ